MGNPSEIDWGGNTLITKNIKVGATKPGQSGTDISAAEISVLDGVTAGTVTASKAVVVDSNKDISSFRNVTYAGTMTQGAGANIDLDSGTATLSSNAATLTKWSNVITTESLTTAAGASQALTLTLTGVAAGDLAFVTKCGGTNTRRNYQLEAVTTSNTITVTVYNTEPTNALNGTLKFNVWVLKA